MSVRWVVLVVLAACGQGRTYLDFPVDSAPLQSCAELMASWESLVAESRACDGDGDCTVVGGTNSCNCSWSLGGCGIGVNQAAYQAGGGGELAAGILARGCSPSICDCAPPASLGCDEGTCRARLASCLDRPPLDAAQIDAAQDAAPDPDATVADAF